MFWWWALKLCISWTFHSKQRWNAVAWICMLSCHLLQCHVLLQVRRLLPEEALHLYLSRISAMPSCYSPEAAAEPYCALKPLWRQADKHALPVFEVWVFVKSSGPLGDGEYLAGCRFHGCFCCSVPCSPLARAAGTPAVHWAVSRWLWPLCTNLPGLPPFVWEHEKCLWQCCCQGLRSVQLQILAAYLLHLSRALKHSLLELLYSLSSPTAYLVALG